LFPLTPPRTAPVRLRAVAATGATRAVLLILGAVTGIVLARVLGPEGRGQYTVAVTIATVTVALGHFSVEQAQIALWREPRHRDGLSANAAGLGLAVGTMAALLAGVVMLGCTRWPTLGLPPGVLLALALASVPFNIAVVYACGTTLLSGRIGVVNRCRLGGAAFQCTTLLALAAAGDLTVRWVVAIWTASSLAQFILMRPRLRRACDPGLARRCLRLGVGLHAGSSAFFLLQRVDMLLLNALASARAVGLYSVAVTVAELARVLADSVTQSAMPGLADADDHAAIAATRRATALAFAATVVSAAIVAASAGYAVPLGYGSAFNASVAPLLALLPGLVALAATRPAAAWLLRIGRPGLVSLTSIAALAVNVVANLVLIPVLGVTGCALASSAGYGVLGILQYAWFLRAAKRRIGQQDTQRSPEQHRDGQRREGVGEQQRHQVGHHQRAADREPAIATPAQAHGDQYAEGQ
jgi:O-antigen/teichoic acid export membrane protein